MILILLGISPVASAADDKLQFSGFARLVLGHLDDKNAEYVGYDNSISLDQQSLLGLQADYHLSDSFSLTSQFVGYTEDQRNSGLQWLYLTYHPNNALQVKLGRQRIPFFNYSDSLDVGFAYPWLTLPQQFYDTAFFSTFDGILANYQFAINDWLINYEGYWGRFDDKIYLSTQEINTKVIGLVGINATVAYKNFSLRASYNQGDVNIEQDEAELFSQLLRQVGFTQSADWLNANGLIEFYQFSANYENLNYFVRSEIAKMVGEGGLVADIDSFYISAGYNFYPYTLYISYGKKDLHFDHLANEIPFGVSPELDVLAATYLGALAQFPDDKSAGTKIGLRWDVLSNLALKTEVTYVEANDEISNDYAVKDLGGFDGEAILYQLAIEWVF
ncbi:porin [Paraglaciecola sp. L3A3]|uniref:porin n=1 Tax=Paraglaciecola sp. L3A3 TaxID=2686358 RepID=UPI00351A1D43